MASTDLGQTKADKYNRLSKFPLLGNDELFKRMFFEVGVTEADLFQKTTSLDNAIFEIQKNCPHEKFEEKWDKERYQKDRTLLSKTCTACGLTKGKPQGSEYQICPNCWGKMKYEGYEPGQGGGTRHYECTVCHHHTSHT